MSRHPCGATTANLCTIRWLLRDRGSIFSIWTPRRRGEARWRRRHGEGTFAFTSTQTLWVYSPRNEGRKEAFCISVEKPTGGNCAQPMSHSQLLERCCLVSRSLAPHVCFPNICISTYSSDETQLTSALPQSCLLRGERFLTTSPEKFNHLLLPRRLTHVSGKVFANPQKSAVMPRPSLADGGLPKEVQFASKVCSGFNSLCM